MNINVGDKFKNFQETEYKILSIDKNIIEVEVTNYNGVKSIWNPDLEYFQNCNLVKIPKHNIGDRFTINNGEEEWEIKDILYSIKHKEFIYYVANEILGKEMDISINSFCNQDTILYDDKISWIE